MTNQPADFSTDEIQHLIDNMSLNDYDALRQALEAPSDSSGITPRDIWDYTIMERKPFAGRSKVYLVASAASLSVAAGNLLATIAGKQPGLQSSTKSSRLSRLLSVVALPSIATSALMIIKEWQQPSQDDVLTTSERQQQLATVGVTTGVAVVELLRGQSLFGRKRLTSYGTFVRGVHLITSGYRTSELLQSIRH